MNNFQENEIPKRKILIYTYIYKYNILFEKWLDWHLKFFDEDNIKIIFEKTELFDLDSFLKKRGHTKIEFFEIEKFSSIKDRVENLNIYINDLQSRFLINYDVVCFLDFDEFLFHKNLNQILNSFSTDYLRPTGIEIIQNLNFENDFDPSFRITDQRNFCNKKDNILSYSYSKPIIVRKYIAWEHGRHSFIDKNIFQEGSYVEDLYLIHLGKFDFKYIIELNIQNKLEGGYGNHDNYDNFDKLMNEWMISYLNYYITPTQPNLDKIPESIKIHFDI